MVSNLENYTVADQFELQLNHDVDLDLYTVVLNYMFGVAITTMMGTKDKEAALRFYKKVEEAYQEFNQN
ncbi:hypothetical protein NQ651_17245 [Acinetobacter baumannii]|nr:hypothetical protein [Acinetobacter baumannii]